jgi:hypothetical protein
LLLLDPVSYPIESHVHGFGSSLFDGVIDDSIGGAIVGLNGSGWLGVAQVCKGGAKGDPLFAVIEEGREFSFGCGRHDVANNGGNCVDGSVEEVSGGVAVSQIEVAPNPAAGLGFSEVRRIAVDPEDHVASVEAEFGIWVGCTVIQKLVKEALRLLRPFGLLGPQGAEGHEHRGIHGTGVV